MVLLCGFFGFWPQIQTSSLTPAWHHREKESFFLFLQFQKNFFCISWCMKTYVCKCNSNKKSFASVDVWRPTYVKSNTSKIWQSSTDAPTPPKKKSHLSPHFFRTIKTWEDHPKSQNTTPPQRATTPLFVCLSVCPHGITVGMLILVFFLILLDIPIFFAYPIFQHCLLFPSLRMYLPNKYVHTYRYLHMYVSKYVRTFVSTYVHMVSKYLLK